MILCSLFSLDSKTSCLLVFPILYRRVHAQQVSFKTRSPKKGLSLSLIELSQKSRVVLARSCNFSPTPHAHFQPMLPHALYKKTFSKERKILTQCATVSLSDSLTLI